MRILVTGSRDWTSREVIWNALCEAATEVGVTLVSGACPTGADQLAEQWALTQPDVKVERHPADWDRHGRAAGPIRNREMVEAGADICLAFIKDNSRGASGTLQMAKDAGMKWLAWYTTTDKEH